jgi:thiosulfate reductase cytochrome b subunit
MKAAAKRSILRWIHLIFTIPMLGYIYSPPAEVAPYVGGVRYIFVPVLLLTGYWMYAGVAFGILGVALWLGAYQLAGFGAALLSQVVLFIARKVWLTIRARRAQRSAAAADLAG